MDTSEDKAMVKVPGVSPSPSLFTNRNLTIFLICLIIATTLWFLNALSKNYTTTISHPVEYVNLPKNKFIVNNPPEKLNLRISAHGFALLRHKIGSAFSPLEVNVSHLLENSSGGSTGLFVIPTSGLKDGLSGQLNPELNLVDISPGVFTLVFDSLCVKQVLVAPAVQMGFKPRFGLVSPLEFFPSRVTVSGPREMVAKTDTIFTLPKNFKNLETSFTQEIGLEIPLQLIVEPSRVLMTASIGEFTEKTLHVPIWIEGQPEDVKIRLFPYDAEITMTVALSHFALVKPDHISLFVSWDDIVQKQQHLKIRLKKLPAGVTSVKIIPEYVEYLIKKN